MKVLRGATIERHKEIDRTVATHNLAESRVSSQGIRTVTTVMSSTYAGKAGHGENNLEVRPLAKRADGL